MFKAWCIRVATHVLVAVVAACIGGALVFWCCPREVVRGVKIPHITYMPEGVTVYGAVVIPEEMLLPTKEQNRDTAYPCLPPGTWEHRGNVITGFIPAPQEKLPKGHTIIFKLLLEENAVAPAAN